MSHKTKKTMAARNPRKPVMPSPKIEKTKRERIEALRRKRKGVNYEV